LSSHSLEYLQVFCGAVQEPATQVRPPEQSFDVVHGQGPAFPPQVSQTPALHVLSAPQSGLVVHSFLGPGSVPGGEHRPSWHVSPFGQVASVEQGGAQPVAVQTDPPVQLALPVQVGCAGDFTGEQP
jgi:hypothetical protein